MDPISNVVFTLRDRLWSGPILIGLIGIGIFLTIKLRGLQFRYLGHSLGLLKSAFKEENDLELSKKEIKKSIKQEKAKGDISSFQALMTALAGAIGTGNITGIATAVATGGFGALFWMWLLALIGMITAYAEAILAIKYREQNENGEMTGGPMYTLVRGLGMKKVAMLFALFGIFSAFGTGCLVQANSVVDAVNYIYEVDRVKAGIVLAVVTGLVTIGGIGKIGKAAGLLVPFMAISYFVVGIGILIYQYEHLPTALTLIFKSAFTGQAAIGGFAGASVAIAIQMGAAYGTFANEAGMGSLSIAAASAKVSKSAKQGMYAISGVFIASMVVCTITGLVLAVTNVLGTEINGELLTGSPLAIQAFTIIRPELKYVVFLGLILFAFTTILAWGYYGEKCMEFIAGLKAAYIFRWVYVLFIVIGAILELNLVWAIAHIANGLMALPNIWSIYKLSDVVVDETQDYLRSLQLKSNVVCEA